MGLYIWQMGYFPSDLEIPYFSPTRNALFIVLLKYLLKSKLSSDSLIHKSV